jgi:hypothetical protein
MHYCCYYWCMVHRDGANGVQGVHEEGEEGVDVDVQAEREAVQAEGPGPHHTVSDSVMSEKCIIKPIRCKLRKCQPPIFVHPNLVCNLQDAFGWPGAAAVIQRRQM